MNACFIWDMPARVELIANDRFRVYCDRAGGLYDITGTASACDYNFSSKDKKAISLEIYKQSVLGEPILLTDEYLKAAKDSSALSIPNRANAFLEFCILNTEYVGEPLGYHFFEYMGGGFQAEVPESLYAATFSENPTELAYLKDYLASLGFIYPDSDMTLKVTPQGFEHAESLAATGVNSKQVFVQCGLTRPLKTHTS